MRRHPDALRHYWAGEALLKRRTDISFTKAIAEFERAIALDHSFAGAWSGIALANLLRAWYEKVPPHETLPTARTAVAEALRLAPTSYVGHCVLGLIQLAEWDGGGARKSLEHASRLNPHSAFVLHEQSLLHQYLGPLETAYRKAELALAIEPENLLSQCGIGQIHGFKGDLPRAIASFSSVLDADPGLPIARELRAEMYIGNGCGSLAIEDLEKTPPSNATLAKMACAYALSGDKTAAGSILDRLLALSKSKYVPQHCFAATYLFLGRSEEALVALSRAVDFKEPMVPLFATWPLVYNRINSQAMRNLLDHATQSIRAHEDTIAL